MTEGSDAAQTEVLLVIDIVTSLKMTFFMLRHIQYIFSQL